MVHLVCYAGGYDCSYFIAQLITLYLNSASFCALNCSVITGQPQHCSIHAQTKHTKIVFITSSVPLVTLLLVNQAVCINSLYEKAEITCWRHPIPTPHPHIAHTLINYLFILKYLVETVKMS